MAFTNQGNDPRYRVFVWKKKPLASRPALGSVVHDGRSDELPS